MSGITFAAVHDSYWTHACDVPIMNRLLRDKFVELHQRPLLQELADSFRERYPEVDWNDKKFRLPTQGKLQLSKVRESPYFFC